MQQLAFTFEVELRPCPSFPHWLASSDGHIWSIRRQDWIRPYRDNLGYLHTTYPPKRTVKVHQVIADAFLGPCPQGFEINHKDFNKANNRPENLEYVTHRENMHHYARSRGMTPRLPPAWPINPYQLPPEARSHHELSRLSAILALCHRFLTDTVNVDHDS